MKTKQAWYKRWLALLLSVSMIMMSGVMTTTDYGLQAAEEDPYAAAVEGQEGAAAPQEVTVASQTTQEAAMPTTGSEQSAAAPTTESNSAPVAQENTTEEAAPEEMPAQNFSETSTNGVIVEVNAAEGVFPAGTTMKVTAIPDQKADQIAEQDSEANEKVKDAVAIDISFYDKAGNKIEPKDSQKVSVKLSLKDALEGEQYAVAHEKNDGTIESVNTEKIDENTAQFKSGEFSTYVLYGYWWGNDKNTNEDTEENAEVTVVDLDDMEDAYIGVNDESGEIKVGEALNVIYNADDYLRNAEWSVSGDAINLDNSGSYQGFPMASIHGQKEGEATLTLKFRTTAGKDKTQRWKITVTKADEEEVPDSGRSYTVKVGENQILEVSDVSEAFSNGKTKFYYGGTWSIESGKGIVSIPDGRVEDAEGDQYTHATGMKPGEAVVKFTSDSGNEYRYQITVIDNGIVDTSSNNATLSPTLRNAQAMYIVYHDASDADPSRFKSVTGPVHLDNYAYKDRMGYLVVAAKPNANYLMTGLGASGAGQLFPVDGPYGTKNSGKEGGISAYPAIAQLASAAKAQGYVAVFGWSRGKTYNATSTETLAFEVNAQKPSLKVTATPDKDHDLSAGERVNFTVKITADQIVKGNATQKSDKELLSYSAKINGKAVDINNLEKTSDNVWTGNVVYTATEADELAKNVTIAVNASVKYDFYLGVTSGNKVKTSSTINGNDSATCMFAKKYRVNYIIPHEGFDSYPATVTKYIVDPKMYKAGETVRANNELKDGMTVDDPENGGTWTFNGWYNGKDKVAPGSTFNMPNDAEEDVYLTGYWTFQSYPVLTLTAAPSQSSYLYDGKEHGVTTFTANNGVDASKIKGVTVNSVGVDAGTYTVKFDKKPDKVTVDGKTYEVNYVDGGSFKITKRQVTLTSASATKIYDGDELTNDKVEVNGRDGFAEGEGVKSFNVTGTQSSIGESENKFTYTLKDNTKPENYTITPVAGTLKVTSRSGADLTEVSIIAKSGTYKFDGNEKSVEGFVSTTFEFNRHTYTITGLTAKVSGTNAGTYTNEIQGKAKILDRYNKDVTSQFYLVKKNGTLRITANTDPITVTAGSASRKYNGETLTSDEVKVTGIPSGMDYEVQTSGSIKNTGSVANEITNFVITKNGKDVTRNFTKITKTAGQLTVEPRTVHLSSESASKVYDGDALTAPDVTVKGDGFVDGEVSELKANGSVTKSGRTVTNVITYQQEAGYKAQNYIVDKTEGTLTITKSEDAVVANAKSISKAYDGQALTGEAEVILPEKFVERGYTAEATATGSITNVGSVKTEIDSLVIRDKSGNDVTDQFNKITKNAGTLTVTKRPVTLSSNSVKRAYDGTVLTATEVAVSGDGFVEGEVSDIRATGSITEVGTAKNTIAYTTGENFQAGNYQITKKEGTLQITANMATVKVTAASESKVYDGQALTAGYKVTGLPEGFTADVTVTGSQTDAGTATNEVSAVRIMNGENDVTAQFGDIVKKNGTLTVSRRKVELVSETESKTYDGEALTRPEVTTVSELGFVEGEATATATGTITTTGTTPNTIEINKTDAYKASNYEISKTEGTLTVAQNPVEISVTAKDAEKTYDGEALTAETAGYEIAGVPEGFNATVKLEGSMTDAGTAESTIKSVTIKKDGQNVTDQFSGITTENGTLTVNKRKVTLTSETAEKAYDGKALKREDVTVTRDGFLDKDIVESSIKATGSVTEVGAPVVNTIEYRTTDSFDKDNYSIKKNEGTLTIRPNADEIIVKAADATRTYNGKALTADYEVTNAPEGFTVVAEVEGSQTDAGSSSNVVTNVEIHKGDADGKVVTSQFTGIKTVDGTLTVEPRAITLKSETASKTYDGKVLERPEVEMTGEFVEGEVSDVKATGSIRKAGTVKNAITFTENSGYKASNYTITREPGYLTVNKIDGTVTVTAQTTSKVYDGTALEAPAPVVTGLPEGYRAEANVSGSITNAGSVKSTVSDVRIFDENDEDVTDQFADGKIETVDGTLKIAKKAVTLKSNSVKRTFNGETLTAPEVTGAEGFVAGEVSDVRATGKIRLAGTELNKIEFTEGENFNKSNYDITYDEGTLEIEKVDNAIVVKANSAKKVYDGTPLVKYGFTVEGLPTGFTVQAATSGSVTNVEDGKAANHIVEENFAILDEQGREVTGQFTDVTLKNGSLEVTPRKVELSTQSAEKVYDGTELKRPEITVTGHDLVEGEATATADRSIIKVGTQQNTIDIEKTAKFKASNYEISTHAGTLEVKKNPVKINVTAKDNSKTYDATELKAGYTVTGVPEGFKILVNVEGTQVEAGESANTVESVIIKKDGEDVTDQFSGIETKNGRLRVAKRTVTLSSSNAEKQYDGTALTAHKVTVAGDGFVDGEISDLTATGSITETGSVKNSIEFTAGTEFDENNYKIEKNEGKLKITENTTPITATAKNGKKVYDGQALTAGYKIEGLPDGFTAEADVEGSQTNVGTADNEVKAVRILRNGKDVTSQFSGISKETGALTVTPRTVTLTSADDSKSYDGEALTAPEVTIGGEGFVAGEVSDITATGSVLKAGETALNAITFTAGDNFNADNYIINKTEGTLAITKAKDEVVVNAAAKEKTYDGEALTGEASVILPAKFANRGYTATATATGEITGAGTVASTVDSLEIKDAAGNVVTDQFDNITVNNASLTINKRSVELTSEKVSREYDGTALTAPEVTVSGEGFVKGEVKSVEATGSITEVGEVANEIAINGTDKFDENNYNITRHTGNLAITQNKTAITVKAEDASKLYDGTALTESKFKVTGLPAGFKLTAETSGSVTDVTAEPVANEITSVSITNAEDADVTAQFSNIATVDGTLTINKRHVTLTSATAEKEYDVTALRNAEVTIKGDGFVEGEATAAATASIVKSGSKQNTIEITKSEAFKDQNYEITEKPGTLTVKQNSTPIVVTAESKTKTYNGKSLTAEKAGYTVSELPEGFTAEVIVDGSVKNVGEATNEIKSVVIKRDGKDVTDQFSGIQTQNGTLTVTKRQVILTSESQEQTFDGTALKSNDVTITGDGFVEGEATAEATGKITKSGSTTNTIVINEGEGFKAENYDITKNEGTLTVSRNAAAITVSAKDASKTYDGKALTAKSAGYDIAGVPAGFTADVTVAGSQKNFGASANTVIEVKILKKGTDYTDQFTGITTENGTLNINKRNVTLTSESASRAYNGKALTRPEVTVSGDGFVEGEVSGITATGSITRAGSVLNDITFEKGADFSDDNYSITYNKGQLTVNRLDNVVTFTAPTLNKVYDGAALTAAPEQVAITGLPDGYTATATVEGEATNVADGNVVTRVTGYTIYDGAGNDVTDQFAENTIKTVNGQINIIPRTVTLTSADVTRSYNGSEMAAPEVTVGGEGFVEGEVSDITATGTITAVGEAVNTITYTTGENFRADNYDLTVNEGRLTVTQNTAAIRVKARKAEKLYDGTALRARDAGYEITGVPEGFEADVQVAGSRTKAGTTENTVESVVIRNGEADVTDQFADIKTQDATLTVNKRTVTLSSETAEKQFDGTALERPEVTVTGDGFAEGEATAVATGSITTTGNVTNAIEINKTEAFDADNYVINKQQGTLSIKQNTAKIVATADDAEKMYDGKALTAKYTIAGVPSQFEATAAVEGSQTNAGTSTNELVSVTIKNGDKDVTDQFANIAMNNGTLTVNKRTVDLTSASVEREYDGEELTAKTVSITGDGFVEGEVSGVKATGAITEFGKITNPITFTAEKKFNEDNYTINKHEGELSIKKNASKITVVADSDNKTYDGKELTAGATITGVPAGFEATATVEGSQTDAGTSKNEVTSVVIKKGTRDVTSQFSGITTESGTLTVDKRDVTLKSATDAKTFDGTALTRPDVTVTGSFVDGEVSDIKATGSIRKAGTVDNTITFTENSGFKADNYNISYETGKLTINKIDGAVTVTAPSVERVYDGQPLTAGQATVTGLPEGYTADVSIEGSVTNVKEGEHANHITEVIIRNAEGEDVTDQFADGKIVTVDGTLKVTPRTVILTSNSIQRAYDDSTLADPTVTVGGDGLVAGEVTDLRATGTITKTGSKKNTIEYNEGENFDADNYNITTNEGDLEITKNISAITVTAKSASKVYDGTALKESGYDVTGTPDGFTVEAETTGSVKNVKDGAAANHIADGSVKILNAKGNDVTDQFVPYETANGTLKVTARPVALSSATASRAYNGEALKRPEVTVTGDGFVEGEAAPVATGSITKTGSQTNSIEINGTDKYDESNYSITTDEGTLTITQNTAKIKATAKTDSKTYDGTALTAEQAGYEVAGVPAGFTADVTVAGSQKDAGSTANQITDLAIRDKNGDDVTDQFADVSTADGTLTVAKRVVTLTSESAEQEYNGTALARRTVSVAGDGFVAGEAEASANRSIVKTGSIKNVIAVNGSYNAANYDITKNEGTLTVVQNSAAIRATAPTESKLYDGQELTADTAAITGVPAGFTAEAEVAGSQTDAGSTQSIVESIKIMNGREDVTDQFSNIQRVNGTLTVTARKVRLTSADQNWTYDGKSHESTEVTVTGDGFVEGEVSDIKATGSIKKVGSVLNAISYEKASGFKSNNYEITEVPGTLTVTKTDQAVIINAPTTEKTYDGTALTAANANVTIPSGFNGYRAEVTVEGSVTNVTAKPVTNAITGVVIRNAEGEDVTDQFSEIVTNDGELKINKKSVELTSQSAQKSYDGSALTRSEVTGGDAFVTGEVSNLRATGSITKVGTKTNKIAYNEGENFKDSNYSITKNEGELKITPNASTITVTANSASKVYDGTALKADYEITGVPAGFTAEVEVEGSKTNVGTAASEITSVKIFRGEGEDREDVTEQFMPINTVNGTLEITPRELTMKSADAEKQYDTRALTADEVEIIDGSFAEGEGATYNVVGTQTQVGSSENNFGYELVGETNADNYIIHKVYGTLRVTPATPHSVIVHYVDGNGRTIAPDQVLSYIIGENYQLVSPTIAGYTAEFSVVTGTMDNDNVEVTVRYTRNVTSAGGQSAAGAVVVRNADGTTTLKQVDDVQTARNLANLMSPDNGLPFAFMLMTLIIVGAYTQSRKKDQEELFDLAKRLEELSK